MNLINHINHTSITVADVSETFNTLPGIHLNIFRQVNGHIRTDLNRRIPGTEPLHVLYKGKSLSRALAAAENNNAIRVKVFWMLFPEILFILYRPEQIFRIDPAGVDSIRLYVNDVNLFNHIKNTIPPFSRVKVDFDYNPAAKSVQYALSLLDVVKIDK